MPVYSEVVSINWVSKIFLIQHSHSIFNNNKKIYELIKGYYILPFRTPKDAFLFKKKSALSRKPQENLESRHYSN